MKNLNANLIIFNLFLIFFSVSCSDTTSKKEISKSEENVQKSASDNSLKNQSNYTSTLSDSESVKMDFIKSVPLVSLPYDVNSDQLDHLSNFQDINNETFNLLQLQEIKDFSADLKHIVLGKVECENNTGLLISQLTNNEYLTWYVLYGASLNISDFVEVFYDNSEGRYGKTSEIRKDQVMITTSRMAEDGKFVDSRSVYLIDNGGFINPGILESDEYAESESIGSMDFDIPIEEIVNEGAGRLGLAYKTSFKGLSEDGIYLLFIEEINTEMIGGPPAINYQLVSSRSGKIIRTIPVSYNPELGNGKKLMNDMDMGQIDRINESQALKAKKEIEYYQFSEIEEKSSAYSAMANIRENMEGAEMFFFIMRNDGEEMIEITKLPIMKGRTVEVSELIVPVNEQFAIILYSIPGSMEYPESLTGCVVLGRYPLSDLYKKIGFNYYDVMMTNGGYETNRESAEKSLKNLTKALNLNGANEYAAYYLACLHAQMNNTEACVATLKHLEKMESGDTEDLLEMVKTESDFDLIRGDSDFALFIKTIG